MKKIIWLSFAFLSLSIFSCQEEEESVVQDTTNSFTKSSPVASLVKRVVQYETTSDNVLDGTSNCSIKLPVHVTVNNHYIYIGNSNDYNEVEEAKENYAGDDVVHFAFPITIIYPNFYEYEVENQQELDDIFAGYGDDSPFYEIACANFHYPISINKYNTDNQVASTVTVSSDQELYNLIDNLTNSQVVGFVFPITMYNSNNEPVTINNNTELETAINAAVDACSNTPTTTLSDVVATGTWHVSYFFADYDETAHYNGYNFTFNSNLSLTVVKNSTTTIGNWEVEASSNHDYFELHFNNEDAYLHNIEKSWDVLQYTSTFINLKHDEGGGECHYLKLTRNN